MIVDSNILILFLAGDRFVTERLSFLKAKNSLLISAISVTEILSFNKFGPDEKELTEKFLDENFIAVPFSNEIAKIAAKLRSNYRLKLPDAAIAATAASLNLPLLSRDRSFRQIKEITLLSI